MISSSLSQAFIQGLFVSGGLIIAIGAQNAFVLKQGLMKNHVFWVALTCFLCDFVLMSFGVLGFGSLISQSPMATIALAVVGALFLAVYGLRAMRSAIAGGTSLTLDNDSKQSTLLATIGTTLALTLLNPHVYLDTVVIIGGVAGTLSFEQKIAFLVGSLLVSATWFFWSRLWRTAFDTLIQKSHHLANPRCHHCPSHVGDCHQSWRVCV